MDSQQRSFRWRVVSLIFRVLGLFTSAISLGLFIAVQKSLAAAQRTPSTHITSSDIICSFVPIAGAALSATWTLASLVSQLVVQAEFYCVPRRARVLAETVVGVLVLLTGLIGLGADLASSKTNTPAKWNERRLNYGGFGLLIVAVALHIFFALSGTRKFQNQPPSPSSAPTSQVGTPTRRSFRSYVEPRDVFDDNASFESDPTYPTNPFVCADSEKREFRITVHDV